MSLPLPPRVLGAVQIIKRLMSIEDIAPYVFDQPYYGGDQLARLKAMSEAADGLIVVIPLDLSNSSKASGDANIRNGWMTCDYLVSCFCCRLANGGTDNEVFTDQLLTAALASLAAVDPDDPQFKPLIQGDSELVLELSDQKEYLTGRTLRLSLKKSYNLAGAKITPNSN